MSDTTTATAPAAGTPPVSHISEAVIRIAGDEADMLLCFYQHSYEGHLGSGPAERGFR